MTANTIHYEESSDKKFYLGQIIDRLPNGKGILVYKNGKTFYGNFEHGEMQGLGLLEYPKDDSSKRIFLAGKFQNNKANGNATLVWDDAFHYGEFVDDSITGWGLRSWDTQGIYKGYWKNNERSGSGTSYYANGNIFEGEFMGNKKNGKGTFTFALNNTDNALSYEGDFEEDDKSGFGTFKWKDGAKYVGEYKNDRRNGFGTYYFPDKTKYVGNWENNQRNGQGDMFSANGSLEFSGNWKNNVRQSN